MVARIRKTHIIEQIKIKLLIGAFDRQNFQSDVRQP